MDLNKFLLNSFLPHGYYDTKKVHVKKGYVYLNYLSIVVCFFCGLKALVVVIWPRFLPYLTELYIVDHWFQRYFHLCLAFVHFSASYSFFFYGQLNAKGLRCINVYFMPNINDICKYYSLELKTAEKFIKIVKNHQFFIKILILNFEVVFVLFFSRCLSVAYQEIKLYHLIFISFPMAFITFLSFHLLAYGILSMYLLLMTTMKLLVFRACTISEKIMQKYSLYNGKIIFKKDNVSIQIKKQINQVVVQFKESNYLFGKMISYLYLSILFGLFGFPEVMVGKKLLF